LNSNITRPRAIFPRGVLSRGAALVVAVILGIGCSKQGEGERCDPANASLDCESGLVCRDASDLGLGSESDLVGAALCCPPDGSDTATLDVCRGGAVLPPDEGTPEAPAPEPEPTVDAGVVPADAAAP
jgi:hypothetical protein